MMTNTVFQSLCMDAFKEFQKLVPKDTGNMRYNASKIEFPSPDVCLIYVDPKIAPYVPYTNFPWIAERWHGKKNPNEGWFPKAAGFVVNYIAQYTQGEIEQNDSDK